MEEKAVKTEQAKMYTQDEVEELIYQAVRRAVRQDRELLCQVTRGMPDLDAATKQGWIEDPTSLQKALYLTLCPRPEAIIWKTIKIGVGSKNADEFRAALKVAGCRISDWTNDMLGRPTFTVASQEVDLDLVVMSVATLGFKKGAKQSDIYARGKELGLDLCPAEVGPQLRLIYKDQPKGEWLQVAMEPIYSAGRMLVFGIKHDGCVLCLTSCSGYPDGFWGRDSRWVFVRPASKSSHGLPCR